MNLKPRIYHPYNIEETKDEFKKYRELGFGYLISSKVMISSKSMILYLIISHNNDIILEEQLDGFFSRKKPFNDTYDIEIEQKAINFCKRYIREHKIKQLGL